MTKSRSPYAGQSDEPIRLEQLEPLRVLGAGYSHLSEDYTLLRITRPQPLLRTPVARRFDGITCLICIKGAMKVAIDTKEFVVEPSSIVMVPPETVFTPIEWVGDEMVFYLLFLSNRFINDINIDLNAVNSDIFATRDLVLRLTPEKTTQLVRFFDLLHYNAETPSGYSRHIARALLSAAGYQMMAYAEEAAAARRENESHSHSRRLTYVRNFLRLVRDNHRRERSLAYYADHMYISPKYLSLVIKQSTGRSAAEWIDHYVLQEAKNLLRFSGKNVQQIAYELNFANQSSFGKYFKHLTGMSPTQFQNS